jgi:2-oxoglutarate dehydrogenase E2 component (dihydrolipoamide succinyltransferase)
MVQVLLPSLAEGVNEATLSYWHFEEGDHVEEGEDLVEMATDKAVFNIPAACSGKLVEVYFHEGELAKVGEVLAVIEEDK